MKITLNNKKQWCSLLSTFTCCTIA